VLLLCGALVAQATSRLCTLSSSVIDSCRALASRGVEACEPEEVARVASRAISSLGDGAVVRASFELPPQGELPFPADADPERRFATAVPLAEGGDPRAMQTLGLLLYSGVGGAPRDERLSARWHAAAASHGNVDGLATLGGCVRRGVGAERDEPTGCALIEASAAAGSPVGLTKLGLLYEEGESGRPVDTWQAVRHFEHAAGLGSAAGRFNYGWALVHGIGVARDVAEGLEQWHTAAALAPEDGAEEAAYHLYEERKLMTPEQHRRMQPVRRLRLAAALGFDRAIARIERAEARREFKALLGPEKGERFVRNDKARAWTAKDERGESML
jgi:TPR repeat protein